MKYTIIAALVAAFLISRAGPSFGAPLVNNGLYCTESVPVCLWDNFRDTTVQVGVETYPEEGETQSGSGTGFYITKDRILTNFHVIDGGDVIAVRNSNDTDEWIPGTVIHIEPWADLAIIEVPWNESAVIPRIVDTPPREGATVWTMGYSLGYFMQVSEGLYQGEQYEKSIYNAEIYHGNSGGALFYLLGDELVVFGITTGTYTWEGVETEISLSPVPSDVKEFANNPEEYWGE